MAEEGTTEDTTESATESSGAESTTTDSTTETTESTSSESTGSESTTDIQESAQEAPLIPDNWREIMAGGDPKRLKALGRFADVNKLAESYFTAQETIRSGAHKVDVLADDASDEDIAKFREANGIPAEAKDYELTLDEGLVIGDGDKPIVDAVLEAAHGTHASPAVVNAIVNRYFAEQAKAGEAVGLQDREDMDNVQNTLRDEWGSDFRANMNAVKDWTNRLPEETRDLFLNARLGNGRGLMNSPELLSAFVNMERQINPVATLVPNSGNDPIGGVEQRIAAIEKVMREDRAAYNRDEKMQAELRDLYEAQDKLQAG